jgi:KaiC/GvpD/RAD55 family RecA-like ATPase
MVNKMVKQKISKSTKEKSVSKSGRVATGIPGFDELVQGGFPEKSSILVCGGPGCGKTIFSMEYLLRGARDFNEKGLYVTFEQTADALRGQFTQFGWNVNELEKSGKLKIMAISIEKLTKNTIKEIQDLVRKEGIKRLVIDSLSTLVINAPIYTAPNEMAVEDVVGDNVVFSPPVIGDYIVKKFVYGFIERLRELDCTSLLISEASEKGEYLTRDTLSEFVCDGVVLITFESLGGEFSRSLIVRKMRQTKNNEDVHPMEISPKGIIVHKID